MLCLSSGPNNPRRRVIPENVDSCDWVGEPVEVVVQYVWAEPYLERVGKSIGTYQWSCVSYRNKVMNFRVL